MKPLSLPQKPIIRLRKSPSLANVYDVQMDLSPELLASDSVECHLFIYPYSRKITADHIALVPFEEYVKDILSNQKSAYSTIAGSFNKLFGLLLGLLIAVIFLVIDPREVISLGAIVSILGAYLVGKEIWDDLDQALMSLTKNWRLRFVENPYRYQLERRTTLTQYTCLAKKERYGTSPLVPARMHFIEESNSLTLRMWFDREDLARVEGSTAYLLSVEIRQDLADDLEARGYMFGVKLSFNRRSMGVTKSLELFQSLHRGALGCIDESGQWCAGSAFFRKTARLGRLKLFLEHGTQPDVRMVEHCT